MEQGLHLKREGYPIVKPELQLSIELVDLSSTCALIDAGTKSHSCARVGVVQGNHNTTNDDDGAKKHLKFRGGSN